MKIVQRIFGVLLILGSMFIGFIALNEARFEPKYLFSRNDAAVASACSFGLFFVGFIALATSFGRKKLVVMRSRVVVETNGQKIPGVVAQLGHQSYLVVMPNGQHVWWPAAQVTAV